MPKFKIEMELTSINERILLTDFDSNNKKINGITFNESISEEENSLYRLSFSIAEEFGRKDKINIGSLISVGRPIWVHLYNPERSIRMVISSFSPVIGPKNVIYNIEAQDYASYSFAKNNVGLTLDTISDEDFNDWMDQRSLSFPPKIKNIADHILQRGWLQKFNGDGWSVVVDTWVPTPNPNSLRSKSNITLNFETSGTNTYAALIELANISNTFLEFDYINEKIYFFDKESLQLDKNYTLKRDFNIQNLGISYGGENLYSIFYVEGGQDEFGLFNILNDATDYKDNFIFNFNYFKDRLLIEDSNDIENAININLKSINIELQQAIRDRFNTIGRIREIETDINLLGDAIILQDMNSYVSSYQEILNIFKGTREDIIENGIEKTFTTPYFTSAWATIPEEINRQNLEFDFPANVRYGSNNAIKVERDDINNLISEEIIIGDIIFEIGFDSSLTSSGFESSTQNGITFYYKVKEGEFEINSFSIISSRVRYTETVSWNQLRIIFPYFSILDTFDGMTAINEARARWESRVEDTKEFWIEDVEYIACINGSGSNCDRFWIPSDTISKEDLIDTINKRIDSYKLVIGEYNPDTDTLDPSRPGKFTIITKIFDNFLEEYTPLSANFNTIMKRYRLAQNKKQEFWYNLKKNRQHILIEGYYENSIESTPTDLKEQAEAIYIDFQKPSEDFSITYIDISDLVGINLQSIRPGDFVTLKEEKLNIQQNEISKLKVASISKVLRENGNINLTIYRHNLINTILEKIIARNQ